MVDLHINVQIDHMAVGLSHGISGRRLENPATNY